MESGLFFGTENVSGIRCISEMNLPVPLFAKGGVRNGGCKGGVNFLGNRLSIELKTANFID